ncbi:PREDICTED: E3 ubiquitin-protein ligase DTX3L-like [Cyprinodon variegatus]|uniref:E3 ubiquitin-protein ligase DTX3L-like n=2 Tax=Cyprinodon TaxID=28741 RepID=UPI0007429C16|nr:PREDICTED: E3 ubiquitin-protein ligase DTX3L-like [Cyprinodon variegatus]
MTWEVLHQHMPSFPDANTLKITYVFPEGVQTEKHPNPGRPYAESRLSSYLPDNNEGNSVLKLLEKAFNQQLLFAIAPGENGKDVITTAAVPLKTQPEGEGSRPDGYPDKEYLKMLKNVLRSKGVK